MYTEISVFFYLVSYGSWKLNSKKKLQRTNGHDELSSEVIIIVVEIMSNYYWAQIGSPKILYCKKIETCIGMSQEYGDGKKGD